VAEIQSRNLAKQDESVQISTARLAEQLAKAYELAKEKGRPADMVTATIAQAKLARKWVERSEVAQTNEFSGMSSGRVACAASLGGGLRLHAHAGDAGIPAGCAAKQTLENPRSRKASRRSVCPSRVVEIAAAAPWLCPKPLQFLLVGLPELIPREAARVVDAAEDHQRAHLEAPGEAIERATQVAARLICGPHDSERHQQLGGNLATPPFNIMRRHGDRPDVRECSLAQPKVSQFVRKREHLRGLLSTALMKTSGARSSVSAKPRTSSASSLR
jgi:hypothetical protein